MQNAMRVPGFSFTVTSQNRNLTPTTWFGWIWLGQSGDGGGDACRLVNLLFSPYHEAMGAWEPEDSPMSRTVGLFASRRARLWRLFPVSTSATALHALLLCQTMGAVETFDTASRQQTNPLIDPSTFRLCNGVSSVTDKIECRRFPQASSYRLLLAGSHRVPVRLGLDCVDAKGMQKKNPNIIKY